MKEPPDHPAMDEPDDGGTVLRFPRDWFGPPEELVPFGPGADEVATAGQQDGPSVQSTDVDLGESAVSPPTADAFWTEESPKVHGAVRAQEDYAGVSGADTSSRAWRPAPRSRVRLPDAVTQRRIAVACSAAVVLGVATVLALAAGASHPARSHPRSSPSTYARGPLSRRSPVQNAAPQCLSG